MLIWLLATASAAPDDWSDQEIGALGIACDSALKEFGSIDDMSRLALCGCAAGEVSAATDPATFQTDVSYLQDGLTSCVPTIQEVIPEADFTPLVRSFWGPNQITVVRSLCPSLTGAAEDSETCACFADYIAGRKTVSELQALSDEALGDLAMDASTSCGGQAPSVSPTPSPTPTPERPPEPEPEPEPEPDSWEPSGFHPAIYGSWNRGLGPTDRSGAFTLGLKMPFPGPRAWLQWQRDNYFGSRTNKLELMWELPIIGGRTFGLEANLGAGYAYGDERGLGIVVGADAEYRLALSDRLSFTPFLRVTRPLLYGDDGSPLREPMLHLGLELQN